MDVHGFDPRSIEVIRHGSNPKFPPTDHGGDPPLLLFFGYISRRKGVHTLLSAMPRVKEEVPQARLVVAGTYQTKDGSDYLRELRKEAESLGLEGSVEFKNRHFACEELPTLFSKARLVAMPYMQLFGCSGVLREAARFSKAVVASDLENIRCECSPGRDLLLVPPGDPLALADAILRLLKNPGLAKRLGESLSRLAHESSWNRIAERTLSLYSNLAFQKELAEARP